MTTLTPTLRRHMKRRIPPLMCIETVANTKPEDMARITAEVENYTNNLQRFFSWKGIKTYRCFRFTKHGECGARLQRHHKPSPSAASQPHNRHRWFS